MSLFDYTFYGPDILTEISFGWFLAESLQEHGFPVVYKEDGTTPVNVVNNLSWVDDPERHNVVRMQDYTDSRFQVPLPTVGYGFVNDTPSFFELGSTSQKVNYTLMLMVASETATRSKNIANFLKFFLKEKVVTIYNYNDYTDVDNKPKIGVLYFENVISTRFFDHFYEPNLATNFSIGITCDAQAEFIRSFS